jgi:hypothetical protein
MASWPRSCGARLRECGESAIDGVVAALVWGPPA